MSAFKAGDSVIIRTPHETPEKGKIVSIIAKAKLNDNGVQCWYVRGVKRNLRVYSEEYFRKPSKLEQALK
jgi:hypothetical protein